MYNLEGGYCIPNLACFVCFLKIINTFSKNNSCACIFFVKKLKILYSLDYRGPAPFHRLTPNKRFEPVFSTVIMAVCSLFNRILLLIDLIPVHLVYCGQTVMIGCNRTSFEWTRAVRHIYGIIRHTQGLYTICSHTIVWYQIQILIKECMESPKLLMSASAI